jgi:hypothetical protein
MSEDAVRAKIAEMKSAPWRTGSFWCLVASVFGILQCWVYPNKVSTEILSGSLVAFAFSIHMQYTLMRIYGGLQTLYESPQASDSEDA